MAFFRTIPVLYGLVLLALALYEAVYNLKVSFRRQGFSLIEVLIQDQFIYFVTFVLISIDAPRPYTDFDIGWYSAASVKWVLFCQRTLQLPEYWAPLVILLF